MATISLAVTVSNPGSGNKYYIDGVLQDTVNMTPGNTYQFDQSDTSNSGHPLRLSTTSDGTHNSGSEYTTGVTTNGTPGSAGAYTQIVVTASTVQTLYYYCSNHSGMGGSIVVGNASTLNYKNIAGFNIQNLSSDPVPYAQALADNPYAGAWSSGGSLNTARNHVGGAGVSNNSALAFGGNQAPRAQTENYNGSSWTEVNDLNNGRTYADGAGTATACLAIGGAGGSTPATAGYVESWDGTNWTEVADLTRGPASPQSTVYGMGSGIQTSALYYGGDEGGTTLARTESWNGSAWTEVADLNQAKSYGAGIGTSNTSALAATGIDWAPGSGQNSTTNEEWNGSSWTEVAEVNTARGFLGCGNYGSVTSALIFGGRNQGPSALFVVTESWNGSAWTEVADLATARLNGLSGSGTSTGAMFAGGGTPSVTAISEEWSFSGLNPATTPAADYSDAIVGQMYYNSTTGQFKAIENGGAPIGTWASGGDMNTQGYQLFSFGSQTSAVRAGGYGGPPVGYQANAENYNGTSWTALSAINDARANEAGAGSGTSTAGLIYGGNTPGSTGNTESWNGSSWTEVNDLTTAKRQLYGVGTSTATLAYGGQAATPAYTATTESWNGTSWTEVNDLNTARAGGTGVGQVYTAALCVGGYAPTNAIVEEWNGSSWTEVGDLNSGRASGMSRSGTATSGLISGGNSPGTARMVNTEFYNGTSWTEIADQATAHYGSGGQGTTSSAAIDFGGNTAASDPAGIVTTEEFTASDFQIKTMTTS